MFILSFFISFLIYLITLCPTVYFGDSGEFITAAYCLGIPHNPGYPLYCILGHLFIKIIPWGSVAFRVNLMSAFWASMAVAMLSLIIYHLTRNKVISLAFALVLAFSSLFWSQALVAEVYSLNAFNFSLLLFILLKWSKNRENREFYLFFFFLGISLAGHLSILCYIPAFLLFIITTERTVFNLRRISLCFLLCILGLTLYLYLPVRSLANPPIDWGNPENLKNFIRHITGIEHRQRFIGHPDLYSIIGRAKNILSLYKTQFSLAGFIAGLVGWGIIFRREKSLFFLAILVFLGDFIYILFLNTAPLTTTAFGLPTYMLVCIGMALIFLRMTETRTNIRKISLSFPLILILNNFYICNMNDFYLARQYGMDILDNLPESAILFTEGDSHLFPLLYLKVVEGKRDDLEIIDRGGTLFKDVYNFKTITSAEVEKRTREVGKEIILKSNLPVYFTSKPDIADIPGRIIIPSGITFHVARIEEGVKERRVLLTGLQDVKDLWLERDFWVRDVAADYLFFCGEKARFWKRGREKDFYEMASSIGHDSKFNHLRLAMAYLEAGDDVNAKAECEKALSIDPYFVSANFVLGEIYFNQKRFKEAKEEFEKVIDREPHQAGIHYNLGLALMELGEIYKAKREADIAIRLDPGLWYTYLLMAEIYEKRGDIDMAGYCLDKVKRLNPNFK